MTDLEDTIIALASQPGGWRGVVRLSGPSLRQLLAHLTDFASPSRGIISTTFELDDFFSPVPVDIYWMPAPHSYTGQDCAEIHTTGSEPILESLIAKFLTLGARAAGPGEFTMRAFLSGKKDLTQSEAVQAVVSATNDSDMIAALQQLSGGISHPLQDLRSDLLNLLADIEAGLDFSTEDIEFVPQRDILLRLSSALAHLKNLQRQLSQRSLSGQLFRVALVGQPNAGKSSLFNALIGHSQAIVSDVAGTTRDYLSHTLTRGELSFELIDTAGIQTSENTIEEQAQTLREKQQGEVNLLLWCVELGTEDQSIPTRPYIKVHTKADNTPPNAIDICTSVKSKTGIEELKTRLFEEAEKHQRSSLAPSLSRCQHHIDKAIDHLRQAHNVALFEDAAEILALEIRLALQELGEMVGAIYTNDLLDRIFTRFCIGK